MVKQGSRFLQGARTLFSGLRRLIETPALWPWALVPSLIFVALEGACIFAALKYVAPWVEARVMKTHVLGDGGLENAAAMGLAALAALVSVALGWLLAALLTPALSAPALERIVRHTEASLGLATRSELGIWGEFSCGIRAWLLATVLVVPVLLLLTLAEFLVPVVAPVTTPLKLLVSALGLSWGLLDYPLTLRGVGARERLRQMRRHVPEVLGFGLAFSALFWLPCCGVVMLPVAVIASTLLVADWRG